jgi:hypothetical protein
MSCNNAYDSSGLTISGQSLSSALLCPARGVFNAQFSNDWFGLSLSGSGCWVCPSGAGVVDGLTYTGCQFPDNGDSGLNVFGAGCSNWQVTGGHSEANTRAGIAVGGGSRNFTITGHRAGNVSNRGPNGVGINIATGSASDNYIIVGNNTTGNNSAGIYDGGIGAHKVVANNL